VLDRGEVDLRKLDRELRNLGIAVYYPFMDRGPNENHLTGFRKTDTAMDLVDRGNGFSEPVSGQPAQRGEIDIVVVPALAADVTGRRIGYGAGYYDATLGDVCPPAQSILVAYQFQMLAELPQEKHDQKCDLIVTDDNLYQPEASAHKDAEPRDMGH
jgi:5-formyltetrahydrofolate cyclo-ligase